MFYAPGFTKPAQAAEADDRPVHPHQNACDDVAAYAVRDEAKAPDSLDDCLADESNEDDSEDELDEDYHGLISCFDDSYNCLHNSCVFCHFLQYTGGFVMEFFHGCSFVWIFGRRLGLRWAGWIFRPQSSMRNTRLEPDMEFYFFSGLLQVQIIFNTKRDFQMPGKSIT